MTQWREDETKLLRHLATVEKLTSGQITRRFGGKFSRSAIIGRLRREGIILARAYKDKPKPAQIVPTRPSPRIRTRPKSVSRTPPPEILPAQGEPAPLGQLGLIPDEHDACRWVHGDPSGGLPWRMCAHPVQKGSRFCPHHHARCYTLIKPKTPGELYVRGRPR